MISRVGQCRRLIGSFSVRSVSMIHSQPSSRAGSANQVKRLDIRAKTNNPSSCHHHYRLESLHSCHHPHLNRHNHFSTFTKSEYIHPLSQIVLEHLQSSHSHWVQRMGLDTGLKLNKDGTFVLHFPIDDETVEVEGTSSEDKTNGSIW